MTKQKSVQLNPDTMKRLLRVKINMQFVLGQSMSFDQVVSRLITKYGDVE